MSGGGGKEEVGFAPVVGSFLMTLLEILPILPAANNLIKERTSGGKSAAH